MLQLRHCTGVTAVQSAQCPGSLTCARRNAQRRLSTSIRHEEVSEFIQKIGFLSVCCIGTLVIGIYPAVGSEEKLQSFNGHAEGVEASREVTLTQQEQQQSEDSLPASDGVSDEKTTKVSKRRGRIRELEEIKAELAQKELELMSKENALLEKEQSMLVLRQELEIERNLRALITKEKEQAEEEAALAMGLCLL